MTKGSNLPLRPEEPTPSKERRRVSRDVRESGDSKANYGSNLPHGAVASWAEDQEKSGRKKA